MKRRSTLPGAVALVALALTSAACSTTDDVSGVREGVDGEVTSTVDTDESTIATDPPTTEPATTEPDAVVTTEPGDDTTETTATDVVPTDTATDSDIDADTEGFVFTGSTGDYTITFPGEPTATPLPIPLPTGQVEAEAFIYEDGTDAAYFTSVFDYPEGTTDSDPQVVLTGARDGAVANVGGTLVDSEFVETNGIPGMLFTFDVGTGDQAGTGNALVYYDAPRLYQSFALGFTGQAAEFAAFLDTFTFIADEAGDS